MFDLVLPLEHSAEAVTSTSLELWHTLRSRLTHLPSKTQDRTCPAVRKEQSESDPGRYYMISVDEISGASSKLPHAMRTHSPSRYVQAVWKPKRS